MSIQGVSAAILSINDLYVSETRATRNESNVKEVSSMFFTKQQELALKQQHGLKETDNVQFIKSSGKPLKNKGVVYTPMSARAKKLQQTVYRLKGKITVAQYEDLPLKELAAKLYNLRSQLKYADTALVTEVAALPKAGCIVINSAE